MTRNSPADGRHSEELPVSRDRLEDDQATGGAPVERLPADDWLVLGPDEHIEWEARPRTMRAAPAVLVSLALAGALFAAAPFFEAIEFLLLLPVALLPAAYSYLRIVTTHFVATNRALYHRRGIVGIRVSSVELDRVQNTTSRQGVLGTRFGYGTVEVDVAGGPGMRFHDVHDPDDVRLLVERLRETPDRSRDVDDQLRAICDELRAIRHLLEEDGAAATVADQPR